MVTGAPKKKFGTGKIIATILGLFLLIGGIGGGVLLTQQNQNVSEKAAFNQACYDDCRKERGTQGATERLSQQA
jgi:uncharacterized protein HemX